MPLSDVTQEVVDELAAKLYPGRAAATLNRQVYTPVCAILKMAETKMFRPPTIKRPKGHLAPSNYVLPPKDWWKRVTDAAEPNLAALLWFWRLHGRRTSEACKIKPEHINKDTWRVEIWDGKGKQKIVLTLSETVVEQLRRYDWWKGQYVFGFSSKSRVYPELRAACKKADVPYHVPKDAGRHSWASHLLEQGATLKEVKKPAGGRASRLSMRSTATSNMAKLTRKPAVLVRTGRRNRLERARSLSPIFRQIPRQIKERDHNLLNIT